MLSKVTITIPDPTLKEGKGLRLSWTLAESSRFLHANSAMQSLDPIGQHNHVAIAMLISCGKASHVTMSELRSDWHKEIPQHRIIQPKFTRPLSLLEGGVCGREYNYHKAIITYEVIIELCNKDNNNVIVLLWLSVILQSW